MRKAAYLLVIFSLIFASSCSGGKTKKENISLSAGELLSVEEASEITGYELIQSENTKTRARFDSDPIGKDPVILELYSYNGSNSVAKIYEMFKDKKDKRPSAEDISGMGAEAFIAYPSVTFYRDGYMVVVTAGSGADDVQAELLKKLAQKASEHLDEYLKNNPTDSDILKQ